MLFSIIHATARPEKWYAAYKTWIDQAANPEQVEYILAIDNDGAFAARPVPNIKGLTVVLNHGRHCLVDAYNVGCERASGKIFILASDDIFPPRNWDERLLSEIPGGTVGFFDRDFVVEVSSGTPADQRRLMVLQILSRARFERLGYAIYPEYESMHEDDDFSEHARQDGVVIDARHLTFEHRHPIYDKSVPWDESYMRSNSPEKYAKGKEILMRRRRTRFGTIPEPKRIVLCMPGSIFSGRWVMNLLGLLDDVRKLGYEVQPLNCYSSDPSVTRDTMMQGILQTSPKPDYVLWLDDDNTLDTVGFQKLMLDLDTFPELDAVFAWCWLQADGYLLPPMVSAGRLNSENKVVPFTAQEMWDQAKSGNLFGGRVASGFPAVLMRYRLLETAGQFPFAPVLGNQHPHGKIGEDYSFCIHALDNGAKLAVDPQVKIPHLKLGAYEPDLSQVIRSEPQALPHVTEPSAHAAD